MPKKNSGHKLERRACTWCERSFQPRVEGKRVCGANCAIASYDTRALPPEERERQRQAAVRIAKTVRAKRVANLLAKRLVGYDDTVGSNL